MCPVNKLPGMPGCSLQDGTGSPVSVQDLHARAEVLAEQIVRAGVRCAGLRLDNGIDWISADFACHVAGVPVVPLPAFFTPAQVRHVRSEAGMDAVIGDITGLETEFEDFRLGQESPGLWLGPGPASGNRVPASTAKVTFTSGTTGSPKGVCLTWEAQMAVSSNLALRTSSAGIRRHLCALPLSVLLENVAGVYAALQSGAEVVVPPLHDVGMSGSSGFAPARLAAAIRKFEPDSLILLPQMLKALVGWLRSRRERLGGLRFVAVGGARTAPELLHEARALGLPVYEGYGLSECCSVVAVNVPGDDGPGSVGQPLPGRALRIARDGEIEVRVDEGVRYLGAAPNTPGWMKTGDLGALDENGFLHVHGRRKQVLITAFGRNVSPEWVESELLARPAIAQAIVLGDDCPALFALISAPADVSDHQVEEAIDQCNSRLPDYARIGAWRRIQAMTPANRQLTANGRVRRTTVAQVYQPAIDALRETVEARFSGEPHDVLSATS